MKISILLVSICIPLVGITTTTCINEPNHTMVNIDQVNNVEMSDSHPKSFFDLKSDSFDKEWPKISIEELIKQINQSSSISHTEIINYLLDFIDLYDTKKIQIQLIESFITTLIRKIYINFTNTRNLLDQEIIVSFDYWIFIIHFLKLQFFLVIP